MASFIQIGGVDMPDPSSFSIKQADVDSENSSRNELGILQRDRVRAGVRTLSVKWSALSGADASTLLKAVKPSSFQVSFPDAEENVIKTATVYAGDKSCEYVNTPGLGWHWNISFDNVEF